MPEVKLQPPDQRCVQYNLQAVCTAMCTVVQHNCMQDAKDASKKEKLAKELEVAASHEELKLQQLQKAQIQLQQKGWFWLPRSVAFQCNSFSP